MVCCLACSSPGSNAQSDAENKDVTAAGVKQISVSLALKTRGFLGNVGGAVGGREDITRGSVYRPFYFPVIFHGGRKKNIQRRCDNKEDKKKHVITACQVDNKVKFINIRTCTQQSSDKPQTKTHTHMHKKTQKTLKTFNQNDRLFTSQHTHKREKL